MITPTEDYYPVPYIELQSGNFYLDEPSFNLYDIAHSLSMLCRYNGHCKRFYSVAEHSLLVMRILEDWGCESRLLRQGLMHDATEAYLSDVPSPFKSRLPDWAAVDKTLEAKLYAFYDLGEKHSLVKKADWYALFIEANQLVPSKGKNWADPFNLRVQALSNYSDFVVGMTTETAKQLFIDASEDMGLHFHLSK